MTKTLSSEQEQVISHFTKGKNLFITDPVVQENRFL